MRQEVLSYFAKLPNHGQSAPSSLRAGTVNLLLRWILPFLGLILLGTGAVALVETFRGPSPREIVAGLRIEMEGLRAQAEACLATRARVELRFQAHVRETQSIRAEVDSLEALDPRGVPQERYDEYLILVDRFNRATQEWETFSAELRAQDPRCRELISAHNTLGDSARSILAGEGLLEPSRRPEDWVGDLDSTSFDPAYLDSSDTITNP